MDWEEAPDKEAYLSPYLCPQLRRSWRGILVSGCPCIRSSRTVHARILKFNIWIPHGKIFDAHFFSCLSYLPFWSYAPLNKMRMKSDACHILWTVHARVFKFHIWIPHGKIADPYFIFLSELPPLLKLCPFEKTSMKSCGQDISKSIWGRGLKLG